MNARNPAHLVQEVLSSSLSLATLALNTLVPGRYCPWNREISDQVYTYIYLKSIV